MAHQFRYGPIGAWHWFNVPAALWERLMLCGRENGYDDRMLLCCCYELAVMLNDVWQQEGGVRMGGFLQDREYRPPVIDPDAPPPYQKEGDDMVDFWLKSLMRQQGWSHDQAAAWMVDRGLWMLEALLRNEAVIFESKDGTGIGANLPMPDFVPDWPAT